MAHTRRHSRQLGGIVSVCTQRDRCGEEPGAVSYSSKDCADVTDVAPAEIVSKSCDSTGSSPHLSRWVTR